MERFSTPEQVLTYAAVLGVRLSVHRERDSIIAKPTQAPIPEKLTAGIREHKPMLLRLVLLREAVGYLQQRYVEPARLNELDKTEEVTEAGCDVDVPFDEFRVLVRSFVEAGIAEFERAKEGMTSG